MDVDNYIDTLELYGRGLKACCEDNGIVLSDHHDALADAEACAKLFLCYQGCICMDRARYNLKEILADKSSRRYDHDTLMPLSEDEIENKDTIFYHKIVVITGKLYNYPDRDELGLILKSFGANVNKTISGKTEIVIVGDEAGPVKLRKIQELKDKGKDIRIIYEKELCEIMNDILK